jgi:hypothetical protein
MTTQWCVQRAPSFNRALPNARPARKPPRPPGALCPALTPTVHRPPPPFHPSQNSNCGVCGHLRKPPPPPAPAYREGINPLRPANNFHTKSFDLLRRADMSAGEDNVLQGLWNFERTMRMRIRDELCPKLKVGEAAAVPLCAMAPLPEGWPDNTQEYDGHDSQPTTRHLVGRSALWRAHARSAAAQLCAWRRRPHAPLPFHPHPNPPPLPQLATRPHARCAGASPPWAAKSLRWWTACLW